MHVPVESRMHGAFAVLLVSVSLAACDGSSGDGGVHLRSKTDVLRELGVLDSSTDFVASAIPAPAESAPGPLAAVLGSLLDVLGASQNSDEQPQNHEVTVTDCSGGGQRTDTKGHATHQFVYFPAETATVNFEHVNDASCVESSTQANLSTTAEGNGDSELGHTLSSSSGDQYSYAIAGDGDAPYAVILTLENSASVSQDSTSTTRRRLRGLEERHETRSAIDTASVLTVDYDNDEYGRRYKGHYELGADGAPFTNHYDKASGGVSIDGGYSYSSLACAGAIGTVSTVSPVTSVVDSGTGTYRTTAGHLQLSLGDESADVVFNSDGTASYVLSNGQSGSLAADELNRQFSEHPCD